MNISSSDAERFWEKVERRSLFECWPWQGALFRSGYGAFKLSQVTQRAHRIAYHLRVEPLNSTKVIMHLCNNKCCCNPYHLYQGTQAENVAQAGAEGKMTRSVGVNSRCRLSPAAIEDIKQKKKSNRAYAREYGVEHHTIARIQRGK